MKRVKRHKAVDSEFLLDIESAVANGAASNPAIAKAVGWPLSSFKNYRYGHGGLATYAKDSESIEAAIKKGFQRRTKTMLAKAEDAIADLLSTDTYEEKHMEKRRVPHWRRGENGQFAEVFEESVIHKVVQKRRRPNALIAMFVAVNASLTDEKQRNIGWRSINRLVEKSSADKGELLKRIDELTQDDSA